MSVGGNSRDWEMNLIELIEADGGTMKRAAATSGGEWAGACPWCGGRDRFRVWPEQDGYWCRQCNKAGDSIQYLRERRGLSFKAACGVLGREPGPRSGGPTPKRAAWTPREPKAPGAAWQERARAFLGGAVSCLWSERGADMRTWLHEKKGLHDATIKAAGLGLNLGDLYAPRAFWGLAAAVKEDGQERRQWIPAGLVIPLLHGADVHRLRVRRWADTGARYVVVSGSGNAPLVLAPERGAVVVVESELDGLLLSQEVGDLAGVVALGTATAKPDTATHEALKAAALVLVSLDTDDAGAKASWRFWPGTYGDKARRWPTVQGKDASEARGNGLDVRQWIVAGLFGSEERFERFAIQTIDGGMTDAEALRAMAGGL